MNNHYNPNQPRRADGQWTDAGAAIQRAASDMKDEAQNVIDKAKEIYKKSKETMLKLGIENDEAAITRASIELKKVLPEDIYFHGTNADFDSVDINKVGDRDAGNWGKGFYVTKSLYVANAYGEAAVERNGGALKLMIIKTGKLKIATSQQANDILKSEIGKSFPIIDKSHSAKVRDIMIKHGFDGVGIGDDVAIFNVEKATKLKTLNGIKDLFN